MKPNYVHRTIETELKKAVKQFPAIALTGPRQSGKSTTLTSIFGKSHQYISFDDPVLRERAVSDPKLFLDTYNSKLILDEIQYVPKILSYIKISIDKNRQRKGYYILTGSQKFNLIKNLGDSLAGRAALLSLLPFSHNEVLKSKCFSKDIANARKAFILNCLRGSYPELITDKTIEPRVWYASYLQTYLERDIRTIYNIGSLREFQRFMQLLASRCSQKLNLSTLAGELGVAVNTIKSWISILEASNIIYLLYPYYKSLGKKITKTPKIYFIDTGLVCYLTGLRSEEHIMNGPMSGALFENYCIQETVKQLSFGQLNVNLSYFATYNGTEIDLLLEHDMKTYPFEIKLTKSPGMGISASLEKICKQFSFENGKIVCLTDEDISLTRNTRAVNILNYFSSGLKSFK